LLHEKYTFKFLAPRNSTGSGVDREKDSYFINLIGGRMALMSETSELDWHNVNIGYVKDSQFLGRWPRCPRPSSSNSVQTQPPPVCFNVELIILKKEKIYNFWGSLKQERRQCRRKLRLPKSPMATAPQPTMLKYQNRSIEKLNLTLKVTLKILLAAESLYWWMHCMLISKAIYDGLQEQRSC
jgi:hypothetical protein